MKRIGNKLKELRKLNKLTLKDVGLRLGIDTSLISRWENDERQPGNNQLMELAEMFGVSFNFLIDDQELRPVNFRTNLPKDSEEYKGLVAVYLDAVENAGNLSRIMAGTKHKTSVQIPAFKVDSLDEIPEIVSQIKDFYKLNKIVSLDELKGALRDKGVFIFEWSMPDRVSGFTISGEYKVVYLNHIHTVARKLFTLAHELGHLILHGDQPEFSFESNLTRRTKPEKEANAFANELLLSERKLKKIVKDYSLKFRNPAFLRTVAGVLNISPDALFYRLMQTGYFSPAEKKNFVTPYISPEVELTPRVKDIDAQVDKEYFTRVYSGYFDDDISFLKLKNLLYTDEETLAEYLEGIESLIDDNIGKEDQ